VNNLIGESINDVDNSGTGLTNQPWSPFDQLVPPVAAP